MTVRQTYTYAELELSPAAYDEIAAKLRAASYDHAFMASGTIDMHGIGITKEATVEGPAMSTVRGRTLRYRNPFRTSRTITCKMHLTGESFWGEYQVKEGHRIVARYPTLRGAMTAHPKATVVALWEQDEPVYQMVRGAS